MEVKRRPFVSRQGKGLAALTPKIISTMILLRTFTTTDILLEVPEIKKRRVSDIVAVLRGAGFIEKTAKMRYTFVGIRGTRSLYQSFKMTMKEKPSPFLSSDRRKVSWYCGRRLVELFAFKDTWDKLELREALCNDATMRRFYDITSVFYGAGLAEKTKNNTIASFGLNTIPKSSSRMVLTISDEDAIHILPELKEHLVSNESVFTF